jgi:hypothetical protein
MAQTIELGQVRFFFLFHVQNTLLIVPADSQERLPQGAREAVPGSVAIRASL